MNPCVICDEKLNLKNHKLVSCEYCNFGACKTCYQTFLPEQNAPKCMNRECGKVWTRKFLTTTFSQSFLQKDWRKSREKIAFDRETAQLPASQEILERRLIIENARRENVILRKQIKTFQQNNYKIFAREARACKLSKKETQTMYLQAEPEDIQQLRERLDEVVAILNGRPAGRFAARPATTATANFVRGCPSEDCRGFLSRDWKCGLCKVESCSKCHVIKTRQTEHTCNPDDVATATLLNRDTKPCPKCHTGIFKIDGCDQMWCTQCHTAFSWRTGELETQIHNPHYYEWQRRNNGGVAPRVPGDNPCVNMNLNQYTFRHITGLQLEPEITKQVGNIIRDVIHLRETEMRDYLPRENERVFLENRILFLKKDISKDIFIRRVLMEYKKREINIEIHQVLEMFIQVSTDIVNRFISLAQKRRQETLLNPNIESKYNYDRLKRKLAEIETLRQYTNNTLKEIYTTFKYKTREISFRDDDRSNTAYPYYNHLYADNVLKTVEHKNANKK
jgi:hypothetical protein